MLAPQFSTTPVPSTKTSPTGCSGQAPVCTLHTLHTQYIVSAAARHPLSRLVSLFWTASSRDLACPPANRSDTPANLRSLAISHRPSYAHHDVRGSDFGFTLALSLVPETHPPLALKSPVFGIFPHIFLAAALTSALAFRSCYCILWAVCSLLLGTTAAAGQPNSEIAGGLLRPHLLSCYWRLSIFVYAHVTVPGQG